ncbi:Yip1 family protein [Bacillus tianshenii]|nr:Yip1 family protein [Bacillus tianshenii]
MNEREERNSFPEKPWLTIWTMPRITLRRIFNSNPTKGLIPLAALVGIGSILGQASGREMTLSTLLALALFFGPVVGVVLMYGGSWFTYLTGKWLHGQATQQELRAAYAWTSLPNIAAIPIALTEISIFGTGGLVEVNIMQNALYLPFLLLEMVLLIWGIVLYVIGISEAQQFSIGKALLNIFIAFFVLLLGLFILLFLLFPLFQMFF